MNNTLHPPAFCPLPLGSIRPRGWLVRQLRIQADGLSGHLDEFWPDIRDSRWFGGAAEAWERAPYWLDGLIPLAYVLNDTALIAKVQRYMDYIITHQHEDGWLGPKEMIAASGQAVNPHYDLWAQFLATKVLAQYHEASGDARALTALEKALRKIDAHIDRGPLFNWGQFRWFEALIGLYYLYARTPVQWLLDLAVKLHAQGFDWGGFFARWPCAAPTPKGRWNYMSHVVNNAMAPKGPALWWRMSGAQRDRDAVHDIIAQLDQHHGMVTGIFTGDECLAGKQPTHGTELCAVVEYAYSLEMLLVLLGEPVFGDRLEKVIFNALPATFAPDMWSHQYDQQVNQVECSIQEGRIWNTNGPESNIFGVEPNYGCCTANLSQGWPKFAAHLWMTPLAHNGEPAQPGLAAVAYAPSTVTTDIAGVSVTATLETEYPFRDKLHFTITVAQPVRFSLWLRIPAWTLQPTLRINGQPMSAPTPRTFHEINRLWEGSTVLDLWLPMATKLTPGYRGAIAVERGPLVYALKMGEDWRRVHAASPFRELPHGDWEVYPTTPWNYALDVAPATLDEDIVFHARPMGETPFSSEGSPVTANVRGKRLPEWGMENGAAADVPLSPVLSEENLEELTLIPYGCTNLRITEFPVLAREHT